MGILEILVPVAENKLALAVIASSNTPLVLLDGDLDVVAASASFCRAFQIDPLTVPGAALSSLGGGEWDVPQLASLLRATGSGHAEVESYEMDLKRPGEPPLSLVLNAHKLDYGSPDQIRILLAVADTTDARQRAKQQSDLLREKAVLLQELQHRVANSLQVIASVLMQSARRVQSDETRGHLFDAHQRVMSVAAVQHQLAVTSLGEVELRPYLVELCRSIGASMIRDHALLQLEVNVDDSVAAADASVSLGLMVTELVINALKHAFPDGRGGKILVDYHSRGAGWQMSVRDNGIGYPGEPQKAKPGLGTSIVQALASQLDARVETKADDPGTLVAIIHE